MGQALRGKKQPWRSEMDKNKLQMENWSSVLLQFDWRQKLTSCELLVKFTEQKLILCVWLPRLYFRSLKSHWCHSPHYKGGITYCCCSLPHTRSGFLKRSHSLNKSRQSRKGFIHKVNTNRAQASAWTAPSVANEATEGAWRNWGAGDGCWGLILAAVSMLDGAMRGAGPTKPHRVPWEQWGCRQCSGTLPQHKGLRARTSAG